MRRRLVAGIMVRAALLGSREAAARGRCWAAEAWPTDPRQTHLAIKNLFSDEFEQTLRLPGPWLRAGACVETN